MRAVYGHGQHVNINSFLNPDILDQMRSELEQRGYPHYAVPVPTPMRPEPVSFSRVIKYWLQMKQDSVRENSSSGYEYIAYKHIIPYFNEMGLCIHEIQPLDIQAYFRKKLRTLQPSTLDKHYTVINGTMEFAKLHLNLIFYNPVDGFVKPNKEQRIYTCYNSTELAGLMDIIQGHILEAPVLLAANFGLRRSEVLGLKWSAIDSTEDNMVINHTVCRGRSSYVTGNLVKEASSYRSFALEPDVKEYLGRLRSHQRQMKMIHKDNYIDTDYICRRDNGRPILPDYLSRNFPKFLRKNGLKEIRFHDLRHSAASNLLNAGFDIYEICEWLGHADIRSTQRYLHITYESKRKISSYMGEVLFAKRRCVTKYDE